MIPEWIERLKPVDFGDVRIIETDGQYKVFMNVPSSSKPKGRGRTQVTGICVGTITSEEGFVANETGEEFLASKKIAVVKAMGGYELLRQLSPDLEDRIRKAYPLQYREIITLALLQAVNDILPDEVYASMYECSVLSDWYPGLELEDMDVNEIEVRIGRNRNAILDYMDKWIAETETEETEETEYMLSGPKYYREQCADEKMYSKDMGDLVSEEDFGRLLIDFVKEQYTYKLEFITHEYHIFSYKEALIKLANLVCLVITPDDKKYRTGVPAELQDFLDTVQEEYPVSFSIDRYLI